jgi:hypothetical protein
VSSDLLPTSRHGSDDFTVSRLIFRGKRRQGSRRGGSTEKTVARREEALTPGGLALNAFRTAFFVRRSASMSARDRMAFTQDAAALVRRRVLALGALFGLATLRRDAIERPRRRSASGRHPHDRHVTLDAGYLSQQAKMGLAIFATLL